MSHTYLHLSKLGKAVAFMGEQLQWPVPQTAYQLLFCRAGYEKSTREGGCMWSGVRPSGIKLTKVHVGVVYL